MSTRAGFVRLDRAWLELHLRTLRGPALAVLVALLLHRDRAGAAWPSLKTLARLTGFSRQGALAGLDRLEKLGLLKRERRHDERGGLTSTCYSLAISSIEGGSTPDRLPSQREVLGGSQRDGLPLVNEVDTKESHIEGAPRPEGETPTRGVGVRAQHDAARRALAEHFSRITGLELPEPSTERERRAAGSAWWAPLREIGELIEWSEDDGAALIEAAVARLRRGRCTISEPRSIVRTARAVAGEARRGAYRPEGEARGLGDLRQIFAGAEVQEVEDAA